MPVAIPSRLLELLHRDPSLAAGVLSTFAAFDHWIDGGQLPFFPEYTDHGPIHIQKVLRSAEDLIVDAAWQYLHPADAAVLALSVLCHDCAMHITEDGFLALVDGQFRPPASRWDLVDPPWSQLWDAYQREAARWDASRLRNLFGDARPIPSFSHDRLDLTERHRLFAGEFLRRHHARLAHEIARLGIPGPGGIGLPIPRNLSAPLLDFAGFVARSHNLGIREAGDILGTNDRFAFLHAKSTFLMAVLRIADALEVDESRARPEKLALRQLRSPVSVREWDAHQVISEIRVHHTDPEALFVRVDPTCVSSYLKVKKLLGQLQCELDESWAALGEVYGRDSELKGLGIRLRRLRSTLDDHEQLVRRLPFVPAKVAFRTVDANLWKLLVGPLYYYDPTLGIRELVQNAADAVCEVLNHERKSQRAPSPTSAGMVDDVLVTVEQRDDNSTWLSITDRGIGMTSDTVLNHFLSVGSSYRTTDTWKALHTTTDGRIDVVRSGRFGIGLLAAFLLGDKIRVITRHVSGEPNSGLSFSATLADEEIELRHVEAPAGTTLEVLLSDSAARELRRAPSAWDWWCFESPRVTRMLDGERLKQHLTVPIPLSPCAWHSCVIGVDSGAEISWFLTGTRPVLAVNGIRTREVSLSGGLSLEDRFEDAGCRVPSLSIVDRSCLFPITLDRRVIHLPSNALEPVIDDMLKDRIAWFLATAPVATGVEASAPVSPHRVQQRGRSSADPIPEDWLITDAGTCPVALLSLLPDSIGSIVCVGGPKRAQLWKRGSGIVKRRHIAVRPIVSEPDSEILLGSLRLLDDGFAVDRRPNWTPMCTTARIDRARLRLSTVEWRPLQGNRDVSIPARNTVGVSDHDAKLPENSALKYPEVLSCARAGLLVAEAARNSCKGSSLDSRFVQLWHEYCGDVVTIPFSREARANTFPKAFGLLEGRIQRWLTGDVEA